LNEANKEYFIFIQNIRKNLKEKKKKKRKKYPNEKNKELKNFETIRPTSRYRAYERSMY